MSLEYLPNEILIECFEYLNAYDIFYSFDRLNSRFNKLLRTIRLYLNFDNVEKIMFDRYCLIIQSNPQIKNQFYSLKLSNKKTCGQIDLFLSYFSLQQFFNLRSLTLIQIEKHDIEKFKLMLPFMIQLYSFRLIDSQNLKNEENEILMTLPMTNLRILAVPSLQWISTYTDEISIITHLTISSCTLDQLLYQLFKYTPLLKYLNVQNLYKTSHSFGKSYCRSAIYLKQLVIKNFEYLFTDFEKLIKLTPNLKRLNISALDNISMIDAHQWEHLIKFSSPYLKIFQFTFGLYCRGKIQNNITEKFQAFQTDFWCKQHQWLIEYVLDTNSAVIYTIPYSSNTYRLTLCSNQFINNLHKFKNVTDLTVCSNAIQEHSSYYFPNINSLKLETTDNHTFTCESIHSIKTILNFSNLKHLDISSYFIIETSSLLEILKQCFQLSSLTINPFILSTLFDDEQLCYYLNKKIQKLNIYKNGHNSFNNSHEFEQFSEIFSNLEQLICNINQSDYLSILLNQFSKLSLLTIYLNSSDSPEQLISWFKNEALKLNLIYRINDFHTVNQNGRELDKTELYIWTAGRNFVE